MKLPISNNKVLSVCKFNSGEGLVLESPINLTYYKFGNHTIIGTDGVFITCYYLDRITPGFSAFGGRKFDLIMHDGEVVNCYGQWWSGINKFAREIIDDEIIYVTAQDLTSLKNCYVYCGYSAIKSQYEHLRGEYSGNVYEYFDCEKIVKHEHPGRLIKKIQFEHKVINEHNQCFRYAIIDNKVYYNYLYTLDENGKLLSNTCRNILKP